MRGVRETLVASRGLRLFPLLDLALGTQASGSLKLKTQGILFKYSSLYIFKDI